MDDLRTELETGGVEQRTFFLPQLMEPLNEQLRSSVNESTLLFILLIVLVLSLTPIELEGLTALGQVTFRRATALQWIADFIELSNESILFMV